MSKQERKSAAKAIADTAQQIWLAGLGAFAKAQEEGSRAFEQLISEGSELERQTRKYTKEKLGSLRETMTETTRRLQRSGQNSYEQLQRVVDKRIGEAIDRLALPSSEEFRLLADQISRLTGQDMVTPKARPAKAGKSARTARTAKAAKTKTAAAAGKATPAKKAGTAKKATPAKKARTAAKRGTTAKPRPARRAGKAAAPGKKTTTSAATKRGKAATAKPAAVKKTARKR